MHIRCPHCNHPVEVVAEDPLEEIACPSCGSSFHLISAQSTETHHPAGQRTLGHFDLIELIGQGHMGSVWKGQDTELDRTVAVKIPRKEHLSREETELFLREARAAAQLSHPNIVPVHEVGVEGETIYIVSDFVHGLTLADWLTGQKPTFREAAELCAKIADALHHAHEAGVIHRDLKPLNILLDPDGEPHVTDFRLAKREAGEITMTVEGKVLGTPAYMAPEQARGEAHRVDRRADVYSLGVILFELLTGERPFRGNVRMLLHQVVFDDAPSPRRLNNRVPRDLETICLECLEKSPERRYATAADLAADLRRWLDKEPIHARPVGRIHRAVRWCQRRPAVATLLAAVVVITVLGFSGVTWQWRHAELARREAQANFEESQRQRGRREANFQKALEAVDRMLTQVGSEDLKDVPQMDEIRRTLLEDALEFYQGFLDEKTDDPDLLAETGHAYRRVGSANSLLGRGDESAAAYQRSIDIFERLARYSPDKPEYRAGLADAWSALADSQRDEGRLAEAEAALQRAIELTERLTTELPDKEGYRADLADLHNSLGNVLAKAGRNREAEEAYLRSHELGARLAEDFPNTPRYRRQMGASLNNRANLALRAHDHDKAEKAYRESVEIDSALLEEAPTDPACRYGLSISCANLAIVLRITGRLDEAAELAQKAFELRQKLAQDFPGVAKYRNLLASSFWQRAGLLQQKKELDGAEQQFRKAVELQQALMAQVPGVPEYRVDLFRMKMDLAALLATRSRFDESEQVYWEGLDLARDILSTFPGKREYRGLVVRASGSLAGMLASLGQTDSAHEVFESLLVDFEEPDGEGSNDNGRQLMSAELYFAMGEFYEKQGKTADAIAAYVEGFDVIGGLDIDSISSPQHLSAIEEMCERLRGATRASQPAVSQRAARVCIPILRRLLEQFPQRDEYHRKLGWRCHQLGDLLRDEKQYEEAESSYREAVAHRQECVTLDPENSDLQNNLAESHFQLGCTLNYLGRHDEADEATRHALELRQKLVTDFPSNPRGLTSLADSYDRLGQSHEAVGRLEDAEGAFRRAVTFWENVISEYSVSPGDTNKLTTSYENEYVGNLARTCHKLARFLFDKQDYSDAELFFRKAIKAREKLTADYPTDPDHQFALSHSYHWLGAVKEQTAEYEESRLAFEMAVKLKGQLADDFPEDPADRNDLAYSYYGLAVILAESERHDEAADAYRKVITLRETLVMEHPDHAEYGAALVPAHIQLARMLLHMNRAEEAAHVFARAVELEPERPAVFLIHAELLLLADRTEEYQQVCAAMLEQFGQSDRPYQMCVAARACLLSPIGTPDPIVPLELAKHAVAMQPKALFFWMQYILGIAHYRAGQYEEACQRFQDSLELNSDWHGRHLVWLGLAMAERQSGATDKAMQWYDMAVDRMTTHPEECEAVFQDWLEGRIRLREAEQLFGIHDSEEDHRDGVEAEKQGARMPLLE